MKKILVALFTVICPLLSIHCSAKLHGQLLIDSLLKELPKQKEDTNKVKLLCNISFDYNTVNPDEGIKIGEKALELATKLIWKMGIAQVNNSLAANYKNKSDYPKALEYFGAALKIDEEIDYKRGIASVLGNIGGVYTFQSDYPKALEYFFKALKIDQEMGYEELAANAFVSIGDIYCSQSDYPHALENFLKALKMYEEMGNTQGVASVTGDIGSVYADKGDYPNALEYFFKALKTDEEIENKQMIATVTGNIGVIYAKQKNYVMAITFGQKALEIDKEIRDKRRIALELDNIGGVYLELAQDSIKESKITLERELPTGVAVASPFIPIGKIARLRLAIDYLQNGIDSAKKINVPGIVEDCYESLAEAYKTGGDLKKAMEYKDDYYAIRDSIFNQENSNKIVQQQMKYDYDKREDSIKLENTKTEKTAALKLQRQRGLTYTGLTGIIALLAFSFFIIKERRKSDKLLLNILPAEVANELKTTGSSAARHFDNVTVLFTDFVNFTQASEKMSPQALIDELHECFKAFDEITGKYDIEKIKTIGDAYLAVCGLPLPDPKHAELIVQTAIEINNFMLTRYARLGDKTFSIRIGIHSGSVVAGIVGVKKFAYDIWGDTVNTAARLEQNSEAGKINISETTYELVKDKFTCEYRGEIEAKNKGMMKMYYVNY